MNINGKKQQNQGRMPTRSNPGGMHNVGGGIDSPSVKNMSETIGGAQGNHPAAQTPQKPHPPPPFGNPPSKNNDAALSTNNGHDENHNLNTPIRLLAKSPSSILAATDDSIENGNGLAATYFASNHDNTLLSNKRKAQTATATAMGAREMLVEDNQENNKKQRATDISALVATSSSSSSSIPSSIDSHQGTTLSSDPSPSTSTSSSSSAASNEGGSAGTQAETDDLADDLDALMQHNYEEKLSDSVVVSSHGNTSQRDIDAKVANGILSMTDGAGKQLFSLVTSTTDACVLDPLRPKDKAFFAQRKEMVERHWDEMTREQRKLYEGKPSPRPPKVYLIHTSKHAPRPGVIVGAATSKGGLAKYRPYMPGPDGEKKQHAPTKAAGDMDPNSLEGMIGGDKIQLANMKPGQVKYNFRLYFDVECVVSAKDPKFIEGAEEAEKNKDLLSRLVAQADADSEFNNGYKTGESPSHYKIVPSADTQNEDGSKGVTAKAQGHRYLTKALLYNYRFLESDTLPKRLNGKPKPKGRKEQHLKTISADDVEELFKEFDSIQINGYTITKFNSFREYEEFSVGEGLIFDKRHDAKKQKTLPKREMKC